MSHTRKNRENFARKLQGRDKVDLTNMQSFMLAGQQADSSFLTLFDGQPQQIADLIIMCILRLHQDTGVPLEDVLEDICYCARDIHAYTMRAADKGKKGLFAFEVPSDDDDEED